MRSKGFSAEPHIPKHRQVFETLSREILSGKYKRGQKFPSEAALVERFQTSRITIGRALRELVQRGLVERIAGSGTYVRHAPSGESFLFGLLIPDLGKTEIFEPICNGIASASEATPHALLWGNAGEGRWSPDLQALQLCEQFIERGVAGVFFAPLEATPEAKDANELIVSRLEDKRIPIILLDRCILPYPHRCRHDLVGIDNRRAGYLATEHLIQIGTRSLSFIGVSGGAPTVDARIAGFRGAVLANGLPLETAPVRLLKEIGEATIEPLVAKRRSGTGIVCANDRIAAQLMQILLARGLRVPQDVRIVGIDDVEYASLLPVPLTTVRQPGREIGEAALHAMFERIAHPNMPPRDILLQCRLIVRASSGGRTASPQNSK